MIYGWIVVGICVSISMYISGMVFVGFTTIIDPIAREMGWSYTQISFASSLRGFECGLLVPVAGMILDRWGPRMLLCGCAIIIGAGLLLLSQAQSLLMFYCAFGLIGIGTSASTTNMFMLTVANWFKKKQGLAMGITASGVALGGILIPLMTHLVDAYGWRQALIISGLGTWAIPLPLALLLKKKPIAHEIPPLNIDEGNVGLEKASIKENHPMPNAGASQALRHPVFWVISISVLFHAMALNAILTHIMPFLTHIGVERARAGLFIGVVPLIGVAGRIGFGWLTDRINKVSIATLALALSAMGVFIFSFVTKECLWLMVLFILFFGIGWGGIVPMAPRLVIMFFGQRRMATIAGCINSVMMIGVMVGPPLAGWVFDSYGSYLIAWGVMGAILAVVTVAFFIFMRRYQKNEA